MPAPPFPNWSTRLAARALAVALAGGLAAALLCACRASPVSCAVCHRDECRAVAFRVAYTDGLVQETCCPRCASHAIREQAGRTIARLDATDFATGARLEARAAAYVEGSDFEPCSRPEAERAELGCCRKLDYDRCLPSLIAFSSPDAARSFIQDHGGSLRSFEDLHFGNPPSQEDR